MDVWQLRFYYLFTVRFHFEDDFLETNAKTLHKSPQWFSTAKNRDVKPGPLVPSLIRSQRSFFRLLHTARFASALRCAHLFARSPTSLNPLLMGK